MGGEELFVLADNIQFIPVNEVAARTKNNFDHDETDIVVTQLYSRKRSKVIGEDLATLMKAFETPKTWAEVIISFSELHKKDPQQVAEEAYAMLVDMMQQGFLIAYKENAEKKSAELFKARDQFKQYKIKSVQQVLDDSEVYRIENAEGNNFALKLLKKTKTSKTVSRIKNEADILQKLDGSISPRLIEEGIHDDAPYLIIEWCEGLSCETYAARNRNYNVKENAIKNIDLCIAVLNAYHQLHRQGVFHADVHTGNIIVTEKGSIKIIDFGFSVSGSNAGKIKRAGVSFYYEPEYAAMLQQGNNHLAASEKGEQYSIAVLLYHLLCGYHYLNFSFETEKLYMQIIEDSPLSFSAFDLNLPNELDAVFSVALAKDPAKRYASLKDFSNALSVLRNSILSSPGFFVSGKEHASERFIDFLQRKFGFNSPLIKTGLALGPTNSVNYGAAGIAYMFYRMACIREDAQLLDLADIWANRADNYTQNFDHAFYSTTIDINQKSVGRRGIYHSPTGVHLVQSLISNCRGDSLFVRNALHKFIIAAQEPCDKLDLTLGKAGLLIGCSLLYDEIKVNRHLNTSSIEALANSTMSELWKQLNEYAPMQQTCPVKYFGMAHGWAGYLYTTLLWCHTAKQDLPFGFENRLQQLQDQAIITNTFTRWPVSNSNKGSWTGWCHGSAGHVLLWSLLYKHLKDEKYLAIAEQTAQHILQDSNNNNVNLCCGMAGQAYALLGLYNITGNQLYLDHTQKIKQKIMHHVASPVLVNNSLYKGEVGLGVLLVELEKPECARMPLFQ